MSNPLFDALTSGQGVALLLDEVNWSYADLRARSARLANALTSLGAIPGDRVMVQVEKSPEVIALYFACLRAGLIFIPLNTAYTKAELAHFLSDATPAVFVCDPVRIDDSTLPEGTRRVTMDRAGKGTLADVAAEQPETHVVLSRAETDVAAILYTSGTTGRSKGAMLTHRNLLSNARTLAQLWRFSAEDVLLHVLPVFHAHGLFVAAHVTFLAGGSLLFCAKFDAEQVIRLLPRATVLMGVPTIYTRLLAHPDLPRATQGMRLFVSGSAPLLAETHRQWRAATGHAILERYGMTETTMLTSNPYDGPRVPGSVGRALPDVDLRITDPKTGLPVPNGAVGMIEVRGPNVFAGYWQLPEKTAAEFRPDGFFITGDLGALSPEGALTIVGRGKDLIISGGFNVYPKEVEEVIDSLPGVLESAVIGLSDVDFGEAVTAMIVPQPGVALDEGALRAALSDRLARFKQPKHLHIVAELPRNAMGKVQKNLLRDSLA